MWNATQCNRLSSSNRSSAFVFHRPEAANEFYDGDHDNDKESDVEIWPVREAEGCFTIFRCCVTAINQKDCVFQQTFASLPW